MVFDGSTAQLESGGVSGDPRSLRFVTPKIQDRQLGLGESERFDLRLHLIGQTKAMPPKMNAFRI